jgi:hypothetical protein
MTGGWRNDLMQNELEFVILDGIMIAVAGLSQTLFYPGFCFPTMVPPHARPAFARTRVQEKSDEAELGGASPSE